MFPNRIPVISKSYSNNHSLAFDGTDAHVTIPKGSGLELYATTDWSISMWLYFENAGHNDQFIIHGYKDPGTYHGYAIVWRKSLDKLNFYDGNSWQDLTGVTITTAAWHHLAISHTGGEISAYWDAGTAVARTISGDIDATDQTVLTVGANITGTGEELTGNMDEIAFFNVALSAAEVSRIYNSGRPIDLIDHRGIVSYWRFEEAGGTTVQDLVGSNHATIQNDAAFSTSVPT